jgi:hypothetical protein
MHPEQLGTIPARIIEWCRVRILRRPGRWLSTVQDDGAHVVPLYDIVRHTANDECVCGPTVEAVPRSDGSVGWMLTHHSLDGREQHE